jgi:uncharacterized heparinase superfamily protein
MTSKSLIKTVHIIGRSAFIRLLLFIEELYFRLKKSFQVASVDKKNQDASRFPDHSSPGSIFSSLNHTFFLDPSNLNLYTDTLYAISPHLTQVLRVEVSNILSRNLKLFGSLTLGSNTNFDWHIDFRTGHRWNPKTYYKRIRPARYPGGFDIKAPWELSRFQFAVRLGQAYWFSSDEKYAREFCTLVSDWIANNPCPYGVNWSCTMEVAIRAVNWLWGLAFFQSSNTISDEFRINLSVSLFEHGRHIFENLEGSKGSVNSNHYLANLVGLVYLGICCSSLPGSKRWLDFAVPELWNEVIQQTFPEGPSYESSIPYHRLSTEMILSVVILCLHNEIPVPRSVLERMERVVEFVYYYTKPNGSIPVLGDQDNGRLHRLAVWTKPEKEWIDHRYLLAIGAILFNRNDFAEAAGDQWQDALWLLGKQSIPFINSYITSKSQASANYYRHDKPSSKAFGKAGYFLLRHKDAYSIVRTPPDPTPHPPSHIHNDLTSFEISVGDVSFIVDSGSGEYSKDYPSRNHFRSTKAHNTIMVDRAEVSDFSPYRIFSLDREAGGGVSTWHSSMEFDFLDIWHDGYTYQSKPILCKRAFYFDKPNQQWIIWDRLIGDGMRHISARFHFQPGLVISDYSKQSILLSANADQEALFIFPCKEGLHLSFKDTPIAKVYGEQENGVVAEYEITVELPMEMAFGITRVYGRLDEALFSSLTYQMQTLYQKVREKAANISPVA